MKKILLIIMTMVSVLSYSQSRIPNVILKNLKGKRVRLSTYAKSDKLIIISFWASWCAPCIKELDAINEHYPNWKDQLDVELLAVTVDDSRTKNYVKPLVTSKNWEYTILFDQNQILKRKMNAVDIPYTVVYYKNKKVFTHSSYTSGFVEELYKKLKELKKLDNE